MDLLRRALLTLLTAAIVARPLLRGESLGLASDLSDAGGLLWVFLVMLGGLGWATWRMYSRQLAVQCGRVELALILGVGLLFVGAAWASYRRAAVLAGWEWVGLVLVLMLTRQLARSEREQQGVFAVVLATGVAMAVQGAYQSIYELPRQRAAVESERAERQADLQAASGFLLGSGAAAVPRFVPDLDLAGAVRFRFMSRLETPSAAETDLLVRRLAQDRAHGPYLFPSTLAGAMVLLIPGLVVAAFAARRSGTQRWQSALAMTAAGVCVGALILTREWLFVLPLILVGGCVAALAMSRPVIGVLISIAATVLVAAWLYAAGGLKDDLERRGDAWDAARRLIQQDRHSISGVGPAMSPFWLPRHLTETAGTVLGPSSALLELWAEGGIFVLLSFLVAAALAVFAVWRWWATTQLLERDEPHAPGIELPLEYYLGGMVGVLLAFVVRASLLVREDLFPAAMLAALGALSWFASFAVYEQVAWTKGERMVALSAGVAALAASLLINPGLGMPALAGLLFVMLGLLLALAEPTPVRWMGHPGVAATLPVPILLASTFGFLVFIAVPPTATVSANRRARMDGLVFQAQMNKTPDERGFKDPRSVLETSIAKPLEEAWRNEKNVVRTCVQLAETYRTMWALDIRQEMVTNDGVKAVAWAALADSYNPASPEGKRTESEVFAYMGRLWARIAVGRQVALSDPRRKLDAGQRRRAEAEVLEATIKARRQYGFASAALKIAIQRDPTDPELRHQLARSLGQEGNVAGQREEAEVAKRLDGRVRPSRRLSNRQRQEVEGWLKSIPAK